MSLINNRLIINLINKKRIVRKSELKKTGIDNKNSNIDNIDNTDNKNSNIDNKNSSIDNKYSNKKNHDIIIIDDESEAKVEAKVEAKANFKKFKMDFIGILVNNDADNNFGFKLVDANVDTTVVINLLKSPPKDPFLYTTCGKISVYDFAMFMAIENNSVTLVENILKEFGDKLSSIPFYIDNKREQEFCGVGITHTMLAQMMNHSKITKLFNNSTVVLNDSWSHPSFKEVKSIERKGMLKPAILKTGKPQQNLRCNFPQYILNNVINSLIGQDECCICMEKYIDVGYEPIIWRCGHYMCSNCDLRINKSDNCPICRVKSKTSYKSLPSSINKLIIDAITIKDKCPKCSTSCFDKKATIQITKCGHVHCGPCFKKLKECGCCLNVLKKSK